MGILTKLVDVDDGFLIILTFVLFSKLDMKMTVGTPLLIIMAKSLLGFIGDFYNYDISWRFLFALSSISITGFFAGSFLSTNSLK